MHCVFMETTFTILFIAGFCDGNTVLLREHFYVGNSTKGWHHAKLHCLNHYTDMSYVLTEDDVERLLNSNRVGSSTSAWIGLKRHVGAQTGLWFWPGGRDVDLKKWAEGEPHSNDNDNCVYARDGRWYNENCGGRFPFYCLKTYNRKLTVVQEMMSWENALAYCRSEHTDLSSLLSKYTAEKVINSTGVTTEFVWTGWRFLMGEWFWVDGETELGNIIWSKGSKPQCPTMPLRCGALSVTERVFEARPCEEKLNFICYSVIGT